MEDGFCQQQLAPLRIGEGGVHNLQRVRYGGADGEILPEGAHGGGQRGDPALQGGNIHRLAQAGASGAQQRVRRGVQRLGKGQQQGAVGQVFAVFPFAHGLIAHAQTGSQLTLRKAPLAAQQGDVGADGGQVHGRPSLSVVLS